VVVVSCGVVGSLWCLMFRVVGVWGVSVGRCC